MSSEVTVNGRRYVLAELFEAANDHVLGVGIYLNQITRTLNQVGAERTEQRNRADALSERVVNLEAEVGRLEADLARVRELVRGIME